MRVLHVMPNVTPAYGGPTYSLAGYARAALTQGIDVTVAAPAFAPRDGEFLAGRLPEAALRLFPGYGRGAFVAAPALWRWLRSEVAGFDVVHVHGLLNPVSSASGSIALGRGVPVVLRPFGMLSRYTFSHRRGALKRVFFRAIDRRNLARVGAAHFTSEQEREEAEWHGLSLSGRAHVVPPPWMGEELPRHGQRSDVRPGGTVVFLGRLNPVKNLESVIAAWPDVVAAVPGATLRLVGQGDEAYVRTLRAAVSESGVAESVRFDGFAGEAEKAALFREADALVLPSFHENFGVAVLEALAHGVPVVVTPEVQLSTFVERHRLGRVVRGNAAGIAGGIVEVLRDPELRSACGDAGPRRVAESFSLGTVGNQLVEMYESAMRV